MPYIEAQDGTEIYVKDWGHEEGRPVILIHGWPLSADSWDPVALALAEAGYRVIAYDRRGFGRSEQPWEGYDYDTFSDDLADVIESADIEPWSASRWAAARSRVTCRAMPAVASPKRR
jgi:non-heme chloroperoxidase